MRITSMTTFGWDSIGTWLPPPPMALQHEETLRAMLARQSPYALAGSALQEGGNALQRSGASSWHEQPKSTGIAYCATGSVSLPQAGLGRLPDSSSNAGDNRDDKGRGVERPMTISFAEGAGSSAVVAMSAPGSWVRLSRSSNPGRPDTCTVLTGGARRADASMLMPGGVHATSMQLSSNLQAEGQCDVDASLQQVEGDPCSADCSALMPPCRDRPSHSQGASSQPPSCQQAPNLGSTLGHVASNDHHSSDSLRQDDPCKGAGGTPTRHPGEAQAGCIQGGSSGCSDFDVAGGPADSRRRSVGTSPAERGAARHLSTTTRRRMSLAAAGDTSVGVETLRQQLSHPSNVRPPRLPVIAVLSASAFASLQARVDFGCFEATEPSSPREARPAAGRAESSGMGSAATGALQRSTSAANAAVANFGDASWLQSVTRAVGQAAAGAVGILLAPPGQQSRQQSVEGWTAPLPEPEAEVQGVRVSRSQLQLICNDPVTA